MNNTPIAVGLIGLGRAGVQMHLSELDRFSKQFTIAAGCDVLPERAADFVARYPGAKAYCRAEELIGDPAVELVSIAAPSRLHVQMARMALAAGKTVFLEKPFALSQAGLDELEELDKNYPGKLYLRHNRRFEACFNHIKDVIASGILGEIFEIKLRRVRHRFRDDWQTRLDQGGGQLNNWGPHLIDQALQFLDYQLESVWSDLKQRAALGDAEDHIKLVFRGKNGMIVDVEISDAVPQTEPVATVYGTRGSLVSTDERTLQLCYLPEDYVLPQHAARLEAPPIYGEGIYSIAPDPAWIREEIAVAPSNGFDMNDIYGYLYETLREGKEFPVKNAEGFAVVRTTLAIRGEHPRFTSAGDIL